MKVDAKWYVERFRSIIPEKHGKPDPLYVDYIDKCLKLIGVLEDNQQSIPITPDNIIVENGVIIELLPELWTSLCNSIKKAGREKEPEIIAILPPGTDNIDLSKPITILVHEDQQPIEALITKEQKNDKNT